MKAGFYPKLAWEGVRKNRRLFFPYILTGSVMVMMFYILRFLMESPALAQMAGGSVLMTILPLGCAVIALFSLLFLFYTNSFLIRQRVREFGLYNVLGMDKRNIGRLMLWETGFTALLAIGAGLIAGVAFSKLAELILLNLLKMNVSFTLSIGCAALWQTALLFCGIYLILLLNSLLKLGRSKPLELMQSSKVGEKIPKYTWGLAVAGVLFLGAAYVLAVRIQEPVTALLIFFIAVVLVIAGTYLLFISGSVAFCKLLQRNKKYYYHPNHFVSVSSMIYRMKRNGAGLASICILLTMVLVMISSTASLYFGEEDSLRRRYSSGVNLQLNYDDLRGISDESLRALRDEIAPLCDPDVDLSGFRSCMIPGMITADGIIIDVAHADSFSLGDYDQLGYLYAVSLEDYNRKTGESKTLADDECLIYCGRLSNQWSSFTMEYGKTYRVKEQLSEYEENGDALVMTMPSVYLVVKDLADFASPLQDLKNASGESMMNYEWRCGFDAPTADAEAATAAKIREAVQSIALEEGSPLKSYSVLSREAQRESFFELYGSLFFLGIMLSVVFLLAAVLIIYYKQLSEGFEDQNRFEIMQKLGMTKKDIRKSINSQMLTVFFMPLLLAGVHLAFAYPFISKIMRMFAFENAALNLLVNLICFCAFGAFYGVVYKITSGAYYAIVSGKDH